MIKNTFLNLQDKVYEEIISCVDNTKEDIDKICLNKLIYLDQVIKETMRMFPVIPAYTRRLTNDATLSKLNVNTSVSNVIYDDLCIREYQLEVVLDITRNKYIV